MPTSKWCFVPKCTNTSTKTRLKIFVTVPIAPKRREKWFAAAMRNVKEVPPISAMYCHRMYCCEDHFDLEEDMKNYMRFKMMGGKVLLKDHVVPHIFDCQVERKQSSGTSESISAANWARKKLIRELLGEEKTSTEKDVIKTETEVQTEEVLVINLSEESTASSAPEISEPSICFKYTQTDDNVSTKNQRTVSVQHKPYYRSKFVQTEQCYGSC